MSDAAGAIPDTPPSASSCVHATCGPLNLANCASLRAVQRDQCNLCGRRSSSTTPHVQRTGCLHVPRCVVTTGSVPPVRSHINPTRLRVLNETGGKLGCLWVPRSKQHQYIAGAGADPVTAAQPVERRPPSVLPLPHLTTTTTPCLRSFGNDPHRAAGRKLAQVLVRPR